MRWLIFIFVIFFSHTNHTLALTDDKGKKRNEGRQKSRNNELIQINLLNFGFKHRRKNETENERIETRRKKSATVHTQLCCVMETVRLSSQRCSYTLTAVQAIIICFFFFFFWNIMMFVIYMLCTLRQKNSLFNKKWWVITNTLNNIEINEAFLFALLLFLVLFSEKTQKQSHDLDWKNTHFWLSTNRPSITTNLHFRTSSENYTAFLACTADLQLLTQTVKMYTMHWTHTKNDTSQTMKWRKKRHTNMNTKWNVNKSEWEGKKRQHTELKREFIYTNCVTI